MLLCNLVALDFWILADMPSPVIKILPPFYQLKVTLIGSRPSVWRRILVPADITLQHLNQVLRIVFGWDHHFMHYFEINGVKYTSTQPAVPRKPSWNEPPSLWWYFFLDILSMPTFAFIRCILPPAIDERKVKLCSLVSEAGTTFYYQFATFTDWRYRISLEKLVPHANVAAAPTCLTGKGDSPLPEFVAVCAHDGVLKVLRDQKHPDHRQLIESFGDDFAVTPFNIELINSQLRTATLVSK